MSIMRLRTLGRWMRVRPVDVGDPERGSPAAKAAAKRLRGSLQLRHVDAGSCNGCEMEIASIFSPIYDAERFLLPEVFMVQHPDVDENFRIRRIRLVDRKSVV